MAGEALFERLRAERWKVVEEVVNDRPPRLKVPELEKKLKPYLNFQKVLA